MRLFREPSIGVLMVCTANICRSPMAEGVLREELKLRGLTRRIRVDSAGTSALLGHFTDGRARLVCSREGIDLRKSRARQVTVDHFLRFNYLLAMDQRNYQWLLENCPQAHGKRISLLGSWAASGSMGDIPDPYFGSLAGFEEVLLKLRYCINGFLVHLQEEMDLARR